MYKRQKTEYRADRVSILCQDFPLTDLRARFRIVFPPAHFPL